jgi:hypothetical protein
MTVVMVTNAVAAVATELRSRMSANVIAGVVHSPSPTQSEPNIAGATAGMDANSVPTKPAPSESARA